MRQVMYLLVSALCLLGLFQFFKPDAPPPVASIAKAPAKPATIPAEGMNEPAPRPSTAAVAGLRFHLLVGENGLLDGPSVIRVQQGDEIEMHVRSQVDDELHLHGYDRHLHLHAGKTVILRLQATLSGRFEYEMHKRHEEIGALEVMPK